MGVDAFSKEVAALCARYNIAAEWFPWTYRTTPARAAALRKVAHPPERP